MGLLDMFKKKTDPKEQAFKQILRAKEEGEFRRAYANEHMKQIRLKAKAQARSEYQKKSGERFDEFRRRGLNGPFNPVPNQYRSPQGSRPVVDPSNNIEKNLKRMGLIS